MDEDFKIVKLSDKYFSMLLELYKEAFGKTISESFLKRKFDTSMVSELKNLGYLAIDKYGDAAAFYGVFPCYVSFNGESILVAQSGDTMVRRKYRRNKLFVKLALKTYDYCQANGVRAVFGFPNIYSFPSFVKKLKWSHSHNIISYEKKIKCLPFLKLKSILKLNENFFLNYQLRKLRKLSILPKEFISINESKEVGTIIKDENLIKYKSFEEKYFILVEKTIVWLKPSSMFLLIGDISFCSENQFLNVLHELEKLAFRIGIPHLRIQTSQGSRLDKLAKKHMNKMDVEYPAGGISFDDNFDVNSLCYVMADNDSY